MLPKEGTLFPMLAYLDPNIHGTLKPRRGKILSPPVRILTRMDTTECHKSKNILHVKTILGPQGSK